MIPQLITLSGANFLQDYLNESDYKKLMSGRATNEDIEQMAEDYPELMEETP